MSDTTTTPAFTVRIDLDRLRGRLSRDLGGTPVDLGEVYLWLRHHGFVMTGWRWCNASSLADLHPDEIAETRTRRMRNGVGYVHNKLNN